MPGRLIQLVEVLPSCVLTPSRYSTCLPTNLKTLNVAIVILLTLDGQVIERPRVGGPMLPLNGDKKCRATRYGLRLDHNKRIDDERFAIVVL